MLTEPNAPILTVTNPQLETGTPPSPTMDFGLNRFQVSSVVGSEGGGFDNPLAVEIETDHVPDQLPDINRRLSVLSIFGRSRRCSRELGSQATNPSIIPELFPSIMYEDNNWVQLTQEAVPRMEHYRRSMTISKKALRPTLDELHEPSPNGQLPMSKRRFSMFESQGDGFAAGVVKFGWIRGVYMRCLLNIWGVMLFLRMGWMVGQAGIGGSILIVLLATCVTIITTLSMSAICTNGEVRGGGAYYMISRSLGPEFGGAIGVIFVIANSVAVAMYIVGAAETVQDLLERYDSGIVEYPSGLNDVRIAGVLLLVLVLCVTGVGMAFENKAQIVLLIMLLAALMDYFVGSCLPPTIEQRAKGYVNWNAEVASVNLVPEYRDESFFSVFSVFFPSVIGILAGANISGDLKDPCSAIPKGTLLAITTTSFSYVLIIIWLGCTMLRDATGNPEDVLNGTYANCTGRPCLYGMLNNYQVMEMSSGFGPIIYVGIFAATLSSALAALVSAPRIFQALCKDKIFPIVNIFAKGYGPNNDPRLASAFCFCIALVFTLIAELNAIAPIISNFFMGAYFLINFSCFHASYVKSPGFRPGFKYFSKWLSLAGSVLCIVVMFIMEWVTALITYFIIFSLYIYINKSQPAVNWGSSTQGYIYKNALTAVTKLNTVEEHVKNYRPAILVLTGNPSSRPPLVDFSNTITKKLGLMVCGHIVKGPIAQNIRQAMVDHNTNWLEKRKVKAFYNLYAADSLSEGTKAFLELVGLGKMRPNVLMVGFKTKWYEADPKDLKDYFDVIHLAFDMHFSVCILRVKDGLDYASIFETELGVPYSDCPNVLVAKPNKVNQNNGLAPVPEVETPEISEKDHDVSGTNSAEENEEGDLPSLNGDAQSLGVGVKPARRVSRVMPELGTKLNRFRRLGSIEASKFHGKEIPPDILSSINQFQKKHTGTIDVWWLYDDGGLTMLIPYILTTRSQWRDAKLRVFCVVHNENALDQTQVHITSLLKKFRIDYTAVMVLPDIAKPPQEESKRKFQKLISKWVSEKDILKDHWGTTITKTDLQVHKDKTNRNIRLKEMIEEHSKSASLIVMTLPLPRKGSCPASLYMAWLDTMTKDLPPILLVRGNQTSVLTFYS